MKNLVIVESPSKTKKLASFLGDNYIVTSSVGHVRDLPKSGLGVDTENNFEPEYVVSEDKKKVVRELKKLAKESDGIYLATDFDREGEAIAWHVASLINNEKPLDIDPDSKFKIAGKLKNTLGKNPKVYRVTFNSITKDSVLEGFDNVRNLDDNLIDAQQARRILDRLVGYKLSPLLWEKIRYGLSAGRVQSVAVRLIVERENEIAAFTKEPYYEIFAELEKEKQKFQASLIKIGEEKVYTKTKFDLFAGDYTATKTIIDTKEKANKIVKSIEDSELNVTEVNVKDTKSHPSPPFTTSTLQQAAASRLSLSPKRTMQVAQRLYEGGYITYMRTDSVNVAPEAVRSIRSQVKSKHGEKYLQPKERYFRTAKEKKTQEAHEAIRPTDMNKSADALPKSVQTDQRKLYDLIYRRTMATQMSPALFGNTTILLAKGEYTFEAKGSVLKFDGFLKEYRSGKDDVILPEIKKSDILPVRKVLAEGKEMSPPPRYNESSLVKELEKFGIGRPSTYASIIGTIQSRGYVDKQEKQLIPTDNGIVVNKLLVDHFPQIVDVDFTAEMEEGLDLVALGEMDWHKLMADFYGPFEKRLALKKKEIKKEDVVVMEQTDEDCPDCKKGKLVVKLGKYGKFLSCNRFPECEYARPMNGSGEGNADVNYDEIPELKEPCPDCGGKLTVKEGRFGKFIACENYPKCKYTKAIVEKVGMKCPECGKEHDGEIVIKRTRKGRIFYGCSRYPECNYASWKKPKGLETVAKDINS